MNKIILTILCFFCLSLISNLAVADKPEWAEKSDWLEAEKTCGTERGRTSQS